MRNISPIIIFAFNRPNALEALLNSLKENPEAKDSNLFIYIDGPREKSNEDKCLIKKTILVAESISEFKSVKVFKSEFNQGLGPSIIKGVSEVINEFGSAIILEDDLLVLPNFLSFMNKSLNIYNDNLDVFSICGYTNKIQTPRNYSYDAYFGPRSSSWGWATWKDRWFSVNWELEPWFDFIKYKNKFNKWGGSDCFSMLEGWKKGKNKSWAIRFCFSQFLQDKVSLFPTKSFIINNGFDGSGTNCKKWSRFKFELMNPQKRDFNLPKNIKVYRSIQKQFLAYNSIPIRVISKIMYMIYK